MAHYTGRELVPGAATQSDASLDDFIRAKVESAYHPCGNWLMGIDALSVTDPAAGSSACKICALLMR